MSTEHETRQPPQPWVGVIWVGFVVAALMALDVFGPIVYGFVVPAAAAGLYLAVGRRSAGSSRRAAADAMPWYRYQAHRSASGRWKTSVDSLHGLARVGASPGSGERTARAPGADEGRA